MICFINFAFQSGAMIASAEMLLLYRKMLITRPPEIDLAYHGIVVVFDLDDTLYPEREYMQSGFRAAAREAIAIVGAATEASDLAEAMTVARDAGRNAMDEAADILGVIDMAEREDLIRKMVEAYRLHSPSIVLPDDSRRLLDMLSGKGVALALITDGRSVGQRAKISALGLERYFRPDNIYISEERGHDKRSMEPFAYMVHRYPEARGFVYVADNPEKDFLYPNIMGWQTVMLGGVYDTIHSQDMPEDKVYVPTFTIDSLSKLPDLLNI